MGRRPSRAEGLVMAEGVPRHLQTSVRPVVALRDALLLALDASEAKLAQLPVSALPA